MAIGARTQIPPGDRLWVGSIRVMLGGDLVDRILPQSNKTFTPQIPEASLDALGLDVGHRLPDLSFGHRPLVFKGLEYIRFLRHDVSPSSAWAISSASFPIQE